MTGTVAVHYFNLDFNQLLPISAVVVDTVAPFNTATCLLLFFASCILFLHAIPTISCLLVYSLLLLLLLFAAIAIVAAICIYCLWNTKCDKIRKFLI